MLAERCVNVGYETIRRWCLKCGRAYATGLRLIKARADTHWHLDEVFISSNGRRMYLRRAVDAEGVVLDDLVQARRNKKLMRSLLKRQGGRTELIVAEKLPSHGAALAELGMKRKHVTGGRSNNRTEKSHLPVRQRGRRMKQFKSAESGQHFVSTRSANYKIFNVQRQFIGGRTLRQFRSEAMKTWNLATTAA